MHIAHNKPLYIVYNMHNIQYIVVKFDDKESDECQKNYMLNAENEWNEKFSEIEK